MTRVRTSFPMAIRRLLSLPLLLLAMAWSAAIVACQAPPPQGTGDAEPRVVEVIPSEAGLGFQRTIRVTVRGLPVPKDEQDAGRRGDEYRHWVLYLNGRPMAKLHPISVDPWQGHFHFQMRRSKDSADAWRILFKQFNFWQFSNRIEVTVGPEIGGTRVKPLLSDSKAEHAFNLVIVPPRRFIVLAAVYVLIAVAVFMLAVRSGMLRVPAPAKDAANKDTDVRARSFSLGRTQMALWFMIVLASYLFLGLITDDWTASMNASALGLMGIAAGTALGAHAIDVKKGALDSEAKALAEQADTLSRTITAAPQAEVAALTSQLQTVTTRLADARATLNSRRKEPARSRNILRDLVTDETGVALHRVQVVVWTAVLCGAFVYLVGRDLEMPEFDATLLTLMGISSGTYLGFKWPEKQ